MPAISPLEVLTLPALLRAACQAAPDQLLLELGAEGAERRLSYRELYQAARGVASGLRLAGLRPGDALLLSAEQGADFLACFWGALLAGLCPAPVASDPERIAAIWQALGRPAMLLEQSLCDELERWRAQTPEPPGDAPWSHAAPLAGLAWQAPLRLAPACALGQDGHPSQPGEGGHAQPEGARAPAAGLDEHRPRPEEVAYLQFSSGSTGQPKGAELTHAGLLANIRQIALAIEARAGDVIVTWMPYYHDMGLIGAHMVPLALGMRQVKLDALYVARRPLAWLEAASRHGATLLTATTFLLGLALRRVTPAQAAGLDLRSVRLLAVGAEPVSPSICRSLLALLAPAGLDPGALVAVYGLAEASVGVSMPAPGTGLRIQRLDRAALAQRGLAIPASPGAATIELAEVGSPLAGSQLRIVDEADVELAEGLVGQIQVRGPQLMRGYYGAADPAAAFCDGWLRTGDLGYLRAGQLVITGRAKDLIIVNGRKHHAADLEELARGVPGLQLERVAVCGVYDHAHGIDRALLFVATRGAGARAAPLPERLLPALRELVSRVRRALGSAAVELIPLAGRSFPRTSSGKLQRYRLRLRYQAGEFAELAERARRQLSGEAQPSAGAQAQIAGRAGLEQDLRALCAASLGLAESSIGLEDSLVELAGSSLQLMELLATVGARYGVDPDPAELQRRPSIAGLASWLRSTQGRPAQDGPAPAERPEPGPAAIVAMACRFPGAETPEAFWELLRAGQDCVRALPATRADGSPAPAPPGAWGSRLDQVACFDAEFFGVRAEEAALLDPQQRLLLELAYETLERAGYAGSRRQGLRIGVFVGIGESGYQELLLQRLGAGMAPHPAMAVASMRTMVAARIAHVLDLSGPALALDSACSSALVALHQASASLSAGECDLALVGGVNLNLTETPYRLLGEAGALAPGGRCRPFDQAADGIVLGEGAAMLLLEPLDRARRAGDQVLALLRGSAVNNDGRALSPMAPNPLRQAEVIRRAYQAAGLDPSTVSYVEAHGTGTPIGDATEARSLAQVFPPGQTPRALGSVKSNLGHLLNAAGMPALIKVVLMLRQRQIPPTLHHSSPNRRFDLAGAGFLLPGELQPWLGAQPLRAGVNAFGFGGTNAHVILEQAPDPPAVAVAPAGYQLLALSARSPARLEALAAAYAQQLHKDAAPALQDLCLSAGEREACQQRGALLVTPAEEPSDQLRATLAGLEALAQGLDSPRIMRGRAQARRRRVAFLFAGQGSQYARQGLALYQRERRFRELFDAAAEACGPVEGDGLAGWCFGETSSAELARTAITQPLLVAFEVALAGLAISRGLRPDALVGHSVGELAAACVAGALSLPDTMALAASRGRLMAELAEPGCMAAVFAPEPAVRALLARAPADLALAAINSADQLVISGRAAAVEQAMEQLAGQGYRALLLHDGAAFHSPLVAPAAAPLAQFAAGLTARPPSIPLLSTVDASWVEQIDMPSYWARQLTGPVLFAPAIERLLAEGYDSFVEIGPGNTLSLLVRQLLAGREHDCLVEPLLRRGQDDCLTLRLAAGRLWAHGVEVDLARLNQGERPARRVALAPTPLLRQPHWLPPMPAGSTDERPIPESSPVGGFGAEREEGAAPPSQPQLQQVGWNDLALPGLTATPIERWLLVGDHELELASRLLEELRRRGQLCDLLPVEQLEPWLCQRGAGAQYGVVYLASPVRPSQISDLEDLERRQQRGVLGLHQLLRAVCGQGRQRPAALWVVSSGAYHITAGRAGPAPEQALVAGLAAALPEQRLGFVCVGLDLAAEERPDALLTTMLRELEATPLDGAVCWRGGSRLARSLSPLRELLAAERMAAPARQPAGTGMVLIAGGAGGIGSALARHLAACGQPALVLAGRSALDARRAALLDDLRALGAQAEYRQVDLTDAPQVERLVGALVKRYQRIEAVIHAAGVLDPGSLQARERAQVAAVLAPKVRGTWLLARTLDRHGQHDTRLILCSSLASVLPGLGGGIADYVAANAFLDAFAARERLAGRPVTLLNWAAWSETGMATYPAVFSQLESRGLAPLRTAEALAAFDLALAQGPAQLVVSGSPQATGQRATRPADATQPYEGAAAGSAALSAWLQALIGRALGLPAERIALDASFLALGLDSLQAVDLVRSIERAASVSLPLTLFFEFQNIRELAPHLASLAPALRQTSLDALPPAGAGSPPPGGQPFPLAPAQLAFYVGAQLYPDLPAFTLVRQTLSGPLEPGLVRQAFALLLARHPSLRARFEPLQPGQREPLQQIVPAAELSPARWFEQRALADDPAALEQELASWRFQLDSAPLFRLVLAPSGSGDWELWLLLHHIIADGWSIGVLLDELWGLYGQLAGGVAPALPEPRCSFDQYVSARRAHAATPEAAQARDWWARLFQQHAAALAWAPPAELAPQGHPATSVRIVRSALDAGASARLRRRAAELEVSLFHLLLAGYARCLASWSQSQALAINVATHGRGLALEGIERLVGCCADQLPLPLAIPPDETIAALAGRVRDQWLAVEQHALTSSQELARSAATRGPGLRTPGGATFSFARFSGAQPAGCPVRVEALAASSASAATRLTLLAWEIDGALQLAWIYPERLFRDESVEQLSRDYWQVLGAVDGQKSHPRRADAESQETPASASARSQSAQALIPARILGICARQPQAVAVAYGERRLSYGELEQGSGRLASWLQARGAQRNQPVGLLTVPSIASCLGILGVLRAGAPWLPLNHEYPSMRLAEMAAQAGMRLLLYERETQPYALQLRDALAETPALLCIDDLPTADAPRDPAQEPDDMAYLIFTSGSTGVPKGVPITHRSIANYIGWLVDTFEYGPGDRLLQTAAISFGAAISQILGPLASGGTIIPLPRALVRDPEELLALVERERPTIWRSVPSLWERLLALIERRVAQGLPPPPLRELRWIGVGGEPLPAEYVRRWMAIYGEQHRIANHYGPSEATINASCYLVAGHPGEQATRLPIGQAIRGVVTRVLDEHGRPCAPGTIGELCIGGVCLSPGYLGRPDLTAERFQPDPWPPATDEPGGLGGRLYRSGDLVRELPDGNLDFIGRSDSQVKLRGYRIELGEIEALLHQHPAIARAAVCLMGSGEQAELVAYLEAREPLPPAAELRRWLMRRLPQHMVPHRLRQLAQLPLTPSGKVDRLRLATWPQAGDEQDEGLRSGGQSPGDLLDRHVERPGVLPPERDAGRAAASQRPAAARAGTASGPSEPAAAGATDAVESARLPGRAPGRDEPPAPMLDGDGAPNTPTEQLLAEIWREVLGLPAPGRNDDFFEQGGDSLLLLQVLSRLKERVSALPRAATLYEHSTLGALARAIDQAGQQQEASLPQPQQTSKDAEQRPWTLATAKAALSGEAQGSTFPLSPTQSGFLLAEALDPAHPTTWCARLQVDGAFDLDLLRGALAALIERHPMLRTVVLTRERPARQRVLASGQPLEPQLYDLSAAIAAGASAEALVQALWHDERTRPFDLERWPLVRVRVLRLASERHVWLIAAHHLIGDGWSAWLFGRELLLLYDQLAQGQRPALPALRSTFEDYVRLIERQELDSAAAAYWRELFAQPYARPRLQLPVPSSSAVTAGQTSSASSTGLDRAELAGLRALAQRQRSTPYIVLLTLFLRQLRRLTGADDLVIGTAHAGRELALPDIEQLFGCFATALPLRLRGAAGRFADDLRAVARCFAAASAHALSPGQIASLLPRPISPLTLTGAQFFFTFLDFSALPPLKSERLSISWESSHSEVQPPSGSELLLAARIVEGSARLALHAPAGTLDTATLRGILDDLRADLWNAKDMELPEGGVPASPASGNPGLAKARSGEGAGRASTSRDDEEVSSATQPARDATASHTPASASPGHAPRFAGELTTAGHGNLDAALDRHVPARPSPEHAPRFAAELTTAGHGQLDAALVGYLPSSQELAAQLGLAGAAEPLRQQLRALLFPSGRPRWAELLETSYGRSGFICLPLFADELGPAAGDTLGAAVAEGVTLAGRMGASCVSLAGMLPALTHYGFGVARALDAAGAPALTTGHALTAVSVARTVQAALASTGRSLERTTLAVVGVGSIGQAALALLLRVLPHPPALLLCDLAAQDERLRRLARELRDTAGYRGEIAIAAAGREAPEAVYQAGLIVAATSIPRVLSASRLRPGTIVVDDSFPPCVDVEAAIARMRGEGDVLVAGGGLLSCGPSRRTIALPLEHQGARQRILSALLPDTAASCQLESLLCAYDPALPTTQGLVQLPAALRYWAALERLGLGAAPLHLQAFQPELGRFPGD